MPNNCFTLTERMNVLRKILQRNNQGKGEGEGEGRRKREEEGREREIFILGIFSLMPKLIG